MIGRLLCAAWVLALVGCGGGTDVDNALVQGQVFDHGAVVASAQVTLMPDDYNPVMGDPTGRTRTMLSDSTGQFAFPDVAPGRYSLEVLHPTLQRMDWDAEVIVNSGATVTLTAALDTARELTVLLPDSAASDAYVFIPGTSAHALQDSAGATRFTLGHVSTDSIPFLGVGSMADPSHPKIDSISLPPGKDDTTLALP